MYDAALAAKYGDSIEKIYRRADDLVGRIQAKLPKDTVFMVMSDHGFHSFRREREPQHLAGPERLHGVRGPGEREEDAGRPVRARAVLGGRGLDATRAYAVGLGQIYFNLRGRESQGIVSAGAEYTALQAEIGDKLVQLTDPTRARGHALRVPPRRHLQGRLPAVRPDLQTGSTTATAWAGRTPWAA
jgi:predicted AlkP superfamily phosphohydrolase/phosphomutase